MSKKQSNPPPPMSPDKRPAFPPGPPRRPGKETLGIITEVMRLCQRGEYDQAIQLTNKIPNRRIALEAHLLCLEHEEANRQ